MKISQIFHKQHRFEGFLPDALPWLAISALVLLLMIIASPMMNVFPDFVLKQSSNNSEALSFLALAIALLQWNSGPRFGLLLFVLGVGLVFTGDSGAAIGLATSITTHGESFVAAAAIAMLFFLPPFQQRSALLILTLVVMVIASQILTPLSPFAFFKEFMTKNAEAVGMIIVFVALTTWVDPPANPEAAMPSSQRLLIAVALGASALVLGLIYPEGVDRAVEEASGLVDHTGLWLLRNLESFLVGIGLLLWLEICRRLAHGDANQKFDYQ
ncbi:MAG: hypothetical protein KTR18_12855 [Acidiferrobacterales bacterium]|nr:hypothetical protein [Acidiferrobacterales bacterium]